MQLVRSSPAQTLRQGLAVLAALAAGLVFATAALVAIVKIEPWPWGLLPAGVLWIFGVAALILFSDGLDEVVPGGRTRRWASEVLHWLSASSLALAVAVVVGAVVPLVFKVGEFPKFGLAVVWDIVIGFVAGGLTLAVIAFSGWAGGWVAYGVRRLPRSSEEHPKDFRWSRHTHMSRRDAGRMFLLSVAGVLLSALIAQLFVQVPATTALAAILSFALPVAAWFVATGAVWFAFDRRGKKSRQGLRHPGAAEPQGRDDKQQRRRRGVTHASALGILVAIGIGWLFAAKLDGMIKSSLANHGRVTGVSVRSVPPSQRVAYLAHAFVPRLMLAPHEQWQPTTVDWYVAHSEKTKQPAFCVPGPHTERGGCRNLCGKKIKGQCAPHCDDPDPQKCAPGGKIHAVYYLYKDPANTPLDHHLPSDHHWAVIEYWIFYNYDSLGAGLITQWHQSDWEQVSVLLHRTGSTFHPVEVGFSEHCYGAVVPASEVSWDGTHPVSFVGRGSHGNYPTENDLPIRQLQCLTRRTPRYLGAAGLFFNRWVAGWSLELPIAYLIGLRDQTGTARAVTDVKPISMDATPDIAKFHGYWGVDNNLQIPHLFGGRIPTAAGPESPQDQGPSTKPFKDMFCSPNWIKVSTTGVPKWVCGS